MVKIKFDPISCKKAVSSWVIAFSISVATMGAVHDISSSRRGYLLNKQHQSILTRSSSEPVDSRRKLAGTPVGISTGEEGQDPVAMAWFISVLTTGLISYYRRKRSVVVTSGVAGLTAAGAS